MLLCSRCPHRSACDALDAIQEQYQLMICVEYDSSHFIGETKKREQTYIEAIHKAEPIID